MTTDSIIFAGVDLSSGRKPITMAGLDGDLNIKILEKGDSAEVLSWLQGYEQSSLAIHFPAAKSGQEMYNHLTDSLANAGFQSISRTSHLKQWLETDSQECLHVWSGHKLLPRRSLEGRLQRCAILYDQGVQLTDPIDMLEEITRYKLIQGVLPLENLPSVNELDALAAAYLAWISINRPGRTIQKGKLVLPASG